MGVAWVFSGGNGLDSGTTVADYEARLARMGASRESEPLVMDATPFYPQSDPSSAQLVPFHLCHHSDYPESSFTLLAPPPNAASAAPTVAAVSDASFDAVLRCLAAYSPKTVQAVEVKGSAWTLADFRLKVGAAVVGGSVKGVVLEVEYAPVVAAALGLPALKDAVADLFPKLSPNPPTFPPGHKYEPVDTLTQYIHLFASFPRSSQGLL